MTAKKTAILIALSIVYVALVGRMVIVLLSPHKTATVAPQSVAVVETPQPPTVSELLRLVNIQRAKVGVPALMLDERLNRSAQMKADDETKYNYFGRVNPNDGRHGYTYIIDNAPGLCKYGVENLTNNENVNTSRQAVFSWMLSPAHYSAMIDAKNTLTGFGISGTQIVEHFCQR